MRIFEVPEGSKQSKGRAIVNLINLEQDDKVLAYIPVQDLKDADYVNENYVILATKKGLIKKTSLEAYSRPRTNGINAVTIREGDELLSARLTNGVTLADDKDEVIGMVCIQDASSDILVVSENGYGKRSAVDDYRVTNRGGKGVKTLQITEKTGELISILNVTDENDLMIINKSGIAIRLAVDELRVMGRATQGVRLISLRGKDSIAAVCKVPKSEDEQTEGDAPEGDAPEGDAPEGTSGDTPSAEA